MQRPGYCCKAFNAEILLGLRGIHSAKTPANIACASGTRLCVKFAGHGLVYHSKLLETLQVTFELYVGESHESGQGHSACTNSEACGGCSDEQGANTGVCRLRVVSLCAYRGRPCSHHMCLLVSSTRMIPVTVHLHRLGYVARQQKPWSLRIPSVPAVRGGSNAI